MLQVQNRSKRRVASEQHFTEKPVRGASWESSLPCRARESSKGQSPLPVFSSQLRTAPPRLPQESPAACLRSTAMGGEERGGGARRGQSCFFTFLVEKFVVFP